MLGPFVHNIDPILGQVGGLYLSWYGLGYTLGFLQMHLFLERRRNRLKLSSRQVYTLSLFIVGGVLLGGRLIEVAFDEWPFYSEHPSLIPAFWLGGMASHGVLLGATAGAVLFSVMHRKSLLLADEPVIPGALLMVMGRIGNFIDGQIVGSVTDVWGGASSPMLMDFAILSSFMTGSRTCYWSHSCCGCEGRIPRPGLRPLALSSGTRFSASSSTSSANI